MSPSDAGLKRTLTLRDLVLLNIVAVYTPSTLSQTLQLGLFGVLFWALASLTFMLPYAAALADLTRQYPREGGVYAWTRLAFGDAHGFICGWCYWVNSFLYLPSIFLGMAAVAALLGGAKTAWINEHQAVVVTVACGALWLSAGLHIVGLGQGKWLQNVGAFGRLAIAAGLLTAAAWTLYDTGGQASHAVPGNTLNVWYSLALWPFVLNALLGLDLGSVMSDEANAPARDIPRSLAIGGVAVGLIYLLTFSAALVTGMPETNVIYGHVLAINSVIARAGANGALTVLAAFIVMCELLGLIGSGAAWLAAPARVPFAIGIDHYLPTAFAKVHPRFGTPYVALLVEAGAATVLIIVSAYGANLQDAYLALLSGSIVLVLVPFGYLFASWRSLSAREDRTFAHSRSRVRALSGIGLAAAILAIVACFIPPPVVTEVTGFELKIAGSVAFMLGTGWAAYAAGKRRAMRSFA
ncbi:MAG: APC family permease [Gemmatimonadaceae bacterium]|nr:APC family permease [Gemmatimonadaceae bacterium]